MQCGQCACVRDFSRAGKQLWIYCQRQRWGPISEFYGTLQFSRFCFTYSFAGLGLGQWLFQGQGQGNSADFAASLSCPRSKWDDTPQSEKSLGCKGRSCGSCWFDPNFASNHCRNAASTWVFQDMTVFSRKMRKLLLFEPVLIRKYCDTKTCYTNTYTAAP